MIIDTRLDIGIVEMLNAHLMKSLTLFTPIFRGVNIPCYCKVNSEGNIFVRVPETTLREREVALGKQFEVLKFTTEDGIDHAQLQKKIFVEVFSKSKKEEEEDRDNDSKVTNIGNALADAQAVARNTLTHRVDIVKAETLKSTFQYNVLNCQVQGQDVTVEFRYQRGVMTFKFDNGETFLNALPDGPTKTDLLSIRHQIEDVHRIYRADDFEKLVGVGYAAIEKQIQEEFIRKIEAAL